MHAHAHDHGHDHARGDTRGRLTIALVLTAAIAAMELVGGYVAHSLALVSDSAHVFMDAIALGIAVFADVQSRRPANDRQTYGFARLEVLGALVNGGLLFAVTILIVMEAIKRLANPQLPEGGLMLIIAGIGAAVNIILGLSLIGAAKESLNAKAALMHVASDAVGAIAVVVGAAFILAFHLTWIDPVVSIAVAVLIVIGVVRIVREAADIVLESVPGHATLGVVRDRMRSFPGVVDVHDLHVWTLGSGDHALSAHVLLEDARISDATRILRTIDAALRDEFEITHVTVQFECDSCAVDESIVCTQR